MQTIDLAEFPHGVRCHVCFHEFEDGEAYSDQFDGVSSNLDCIITNIICVPCSGGHAIEYEPITLHLSSPTKEF